MADLKEKLEGAVRRLTLEDIVQAQDIRQKDVQVPEWGGYVTIRSLTQLEATRIADATVTFDGDKRTLDKALYQKLVLQAALVFPTLDEAGAEAILAKSKNAVASLMEEIEKLNGKSQTQKEVEDSFRVAAPKV